MGKKKARKISGFIIPYFFFCKVAGRIICPNVPVYGFSPYPEVPIADVEPFTSGTAVSMSFDQEFPVFEPGHQFITEVIPDFTERTFPYIPKGVMSPELVSVH